MNPQTKSVLVVDDEPGMRLALKATFERDGWLVETAAGAVGSGAQVRADFLSPDGD